MLHRLQWFLLRLSLIVLELEETLAHYQHSLTEPHVMLPDVLLKVLGM
jgi:hypothetical protein